MYHHVYALSIRYAIAVVLSMIPIVNAVCVHCSDNIDGCRGGTECPLITGTAANAAIIAGASTGLVVLTHLLPLKFLRAFPRSVLDTLSAIASAPKAGQPFEFASKSISAIFTAVVNGHCTAREALVELQKKMLAIPDDADDADARISKLSKTMDVIKTMMSDKHTPLVQTEGDGSFLYVWAITDKCIRETEAIVLSMCTMVDDDDKVGGKGKATAKLARPATMAEFTSRLNAWVMICHATGLCNALIAGKFLEEVVYAMLRKGHDWKVVHEFMLIHLRVVENSTQYTLATVADSGGLDSRMKEAEANAAMYFRTRGEKPRNDGLHPGANGSKQVPYDCAYHKDGTQYCYSFNLKQQHPKNSLDGGGVCKFLHLCDKHLTGDDGKKSDDICKSAKHCRVNCDNPKRWTGA